MNLKKYNLNGILQIRTKSGKELKGTVAQYCYPEDNEGIDKESLIIHNLKDDEYYNLFDTDIETIEFIDKEIA